MYVDVNITENERVIWGSSLGGNDERARSDNFCEPTQTVDREQARDEQGGWKRGSL